MKNIKHLLIAIFVFLASFYAGYTTYRVPAEKPTVGQSTAIKEPIKAPEQTDGILPTVPGALNPDVTQDTINSTICVSGWTATVRPSVTYTNKIKIALAKLLGFKVADGELDHAISIELGGSPTDQNNLWFEPYNIPYGARSKDVVESYLKREVCAGRMSLFVAQRLIMNSWPTIYDGLKRKVGGVEDVVDEDDI